MYFFKKKYIFSIEFFMVAVAQLVRALVCGTGGRGFKSPQPPHFSEIFKANFSEIFKAKCNQLQGNPSFNVLFCGKNIRMNNLC